jgi:hypothetical protein
MYARGLHRRYPWFALYTLLQLLTEPVLFVLFRSSYTVYYWGYWTSILISTLLSAAVLYEVARIPFRGDVAPPRRAAFWFVALLSLMVALPLLLIVSYFDPNAAKGDLVLSAILAANRSVRLVQCGLFLLFLIFAKRLGVKYGDLSVGIIRGFGVLAMVTLLISAAMSHPWIAHLAVLRWMKSFFYDFVCLIWLAYALKIPVARAPALT